MTVSVVISIGLWFPWQSDKLDRPQADLVPVVHVGLADTAPADTRVFFEFDPWESNPRSPPVSIVLGQSNEPGPSTPVPFRITFDTSLSPAGGACRQRIGALCVEGPASVRDAGDGVIEGTFDSHGTTRIEASTPFVGASRNGPYSAFNCEFLPLPDAAPGFGYPKRGVETELFVGDQIEEGDAIGSGAVRYESFFPAEPYRLYPDGWAWLVPPPGGPVGTQFTDINSEQRIKRNSDAAGLALGIMLALFFQFAFELMKDVAGSGPTPTSAPQGDGGGPPDEGS